MKLPVIVSLLTAMLLQASVSHAQIRPDDRDGRGGKGSEERDSDSPGRYEPPQREDPREPIRPDPRPDRDDDYNPWQPNPNPVRPDPRPDYDWDDSDNGGSWGGGSGNSGGGYDGGYNNCTGGRNAESGDSYPPTSGSCQDEPSESSYTHSVEFRDVTRKVQGEWLRVFFNKPISVYTLEVTSSGFPVQLHEAYAYTSDGKKTSLSDIITGSSTYIQKSYKFGNEKIAYVDIRAESMRGSATVKVEIVSRQEKPNIKPVRF